MDSPFNIFPDWVTFGFFLASLIGLYFTWYQQRRDVKQKRAELAVRLIQGYLQDSEATNIFYKLEYRHVDDVSSFIGSPDELKLGKMLRYFDKVALLYERGDISLNDLKLISYEFIRVYQNPIVREYFQAIDQKYSPNEKDRTFRHFRRTAGQLETSLTGRIIPSDQAIKLLKGEIGIKPSPSSNDTTTLEPLGDEVRSKAEDQQPRTVSEISYTLYLLIFTVIGFLFFRLLISEELVVVLGTIAVAVAGMWIVVVLSRLKSVLRILKGSETYRDWNI